MFHSKVSIDADNKTLNLYQAFIVSKTPIHYLSLVQNAENKTKEERGNIARPDPANKG